MGLAQELQGQVGVQRERPVLKRPAFQFYPSDWRNDAALQSCSIAARGLWHELLCVMHECTPYGYLAINGVGMDETQAARLVGVSPAEFRKLLAELERFGVFSRTDGVIYSRRMVKDEHLRETRAAAGRLGGNPNLVNQTPKQTDNQEPTPSSTSSSSTSLTPKTKPKSRCALPDWVERELWEQFIQHRKELKKPLTAHAERLLLAELDRLRERGYDPPAVVNQSIASGWLGLFPIKAEWNRNDLSTRRANTIAALTGSNVIEGTSRIVD